MITESLLRQIEEGRSGKNHGFSMGLPKLEGLTDGVIPGNYTLVFSKSGVGKTSLVLYAYIYRPLMDHIDDDNFKVFYASLEMKADLIFAKLLAMYIFETYGIEVSVKELLSRKKDYVLTDELYTIVKECEPWLKKVEKRLIIYDKAMNAEILYTLLMKDLETLGTFVETEHRKIYTPKNPNLVYLVVIDHASLLRPNKEKGRTLKEEIDLVSAYLVTLRNMCNISPLMIMQANRDSTSMDRRKAGLNNMRIDDCKDSGNVAQDAETVISIFSPQREELSTYHKYNIEVLRDNFRAVTILKNRYGESDVEIGMNFFGKCGIWKELPVPEDIYDYAKYTNPNYLLEDEMVTKELDKPIQEDEVTKNKFEFRL